MLVFTRKVGEQIVIQAGTERIIVTVPYQQGVDKVRIGVDASPNVAIHRMEIAKKIYPDLKGEPTNA